ncbi:MAG: hypothetical protein AAFP84_17200 [Actinomycetota bacterium]
MRRVRVLPAVAASLLAACGGASNEAVFDEAVPDSIVPDAASGADASVAETSDGTSSPSGRVTLDQLADPESDIVLSEVAGVDLQRAAPPESLTFCEAAAMAPTRWADDAVVPLQFFIDAFGAIRDVPDDLRKDLDTLLAHARQRLDWNFRRAEQPDSAAILDESFRVTAAAAERCALPALIGRTEAFTAWPWGGEPGSLPDDEIEARCAADLDELATEIVWFQAEFGRAPAHVAEIETASWMLGTYYFGSELHVVETLDGVTSPAPTPTGPCR